MWGRSATKRKAMQVRHAWIFCSPQKMAPEYGVTLYILLFDKPLQYADHKAKRRRKIIVGCRYKFVNSTRRDFSIRQGCIYWGKSKKTFGRECHLFCWVVKCWTGSLFPHLLDAGFINLSFQSFEFSTSCTRHRSESSPYRSGEVF